MRFLEEFNYTLLGVVVVVVVVAVSVSVSVSVVGVFELNRYKDLDYAKRESRVSQAENCLDNGGFPIKDTHNGRIVKVYCVDPSVLVSTSAKIKHNKTFDSSVSDRELAFFIKLTKPLQ